MPRKIESEFTLCGDDWDYISETLSRFGVNSRRIVANWWLSHIEEMFEEVSMANIGAMSQLERARPGSVSALNKQFGISCFARHHPDLLIRQFDQRNETTIPYGIVAMAIDDWKGHFYSQRDIYAQLAEPISGSVATRMFEVDSDVGLAKAVVRAHHKYGLDNKIKFGVLAGHSSLDSLDLGYEHGSRRRELLKHVICGAPHIVRRVLAAFDPKATIVVDGCRAGKLNGLAHELSKLGVLALGAQRTNSTVKRFNPTLIESPDGIKITLDPRFLASKKGVFYMGNRITE